MSDPRIQNKINFIFLYTVTLGLYFYYWFFRFYTQFHSGLRDSWSPLKRTVVLVAGVFVTYYFFSICSLLENLLFDSSGFLESLSNEIMFVVVVLSWLLSDCILAFYFYRLIDDAIKILDIAVGPAFNPRNIIAGFFVLKILGNFFSFSGSMLVYMGTENSPQGVSQILAAILPLSVIYFQGVMVWCVQDQINTCLIQHRDKH